MVADRAIEHMVLKVQALVFLRIFGQEIGHIGQVATRQGDAVRRPKSFFNMDMRIVPLYMPGSVDG